MKIVHISEYYLDGWRYQENLLPEFQSMAGHSVTMLASTNYPRYYKKKHYEGKMTYFVNNVKIIRYKLLRNFPITKLIDIYSLIEKEKPDLLFIHGFHLLRDRSIIKYLKKNKSCIVAMDTHADRFSSGFDQALLLKSIIKRGIYHFIYRPLIKKSLPYINKVFYVSPSSGVFAQQVLRIPEDKLSFLRLGVDFSMIQYEQAESVRKEIRKQLGIQDSDVVFLTIGKQDKNKQTDSLINSFLKANIKGSQLVIAGNFKEDYFQEIVKLKGQAQNIHLIGWVDPKEINKYFFSSDIGVFPGGQSVLWQQAMACGLPCIYKYWEGVEYLDGGGAYFWNSSEEELSNKMKKLASDLDSLKIAGECQKVHAMIFFDYSKIAAESVI